MDPTSRGFFAQNLPVRTPIVNNYSTIIHRGATQSKQSNTNENLDLQKYGTVDYESLAIKRHFNDFTTINKNSDLAMLRLSDEPSFFQMNNYMTTTNGRGRNPLRDNDLTTLGCGGVLGGELSLERTAKSTRNVHRVEREWLDRLQAEKDRHRTRERESKQQISRLNNDLK